MRREQMGSWIMEYEKWDDDSRRNNKLQMGSGPMKCEIMTYENRTYEIVGKDKWGLPEAEKWDMRKWLLTNEMWEVLMWQMTFILMRNDKWQ